MTGCITTYSGFPEVEKESFIREKRNLPFSVKFADFPKFWGDEVKWFDPILGGGGGPIAGLWILMLMSMVYSPLPGEGRYDELIEAFNDNPLFTSSTPNTDEGQAKYWVGVTVTQGEPSKGAIAATSMASVLLFLIPSYSGDFTDTVTYELYKDRRFLKSYTYTITQHKVIWLPFIALLWINLFTTGIDEAMRATVYQFFLDAEQDGFFDASIEMTEGK